MTETLEDRIKRHEGLRLQAYTDTTGHLTIGWGHRIQPGDPTEVTEEEAEQLLQQDIQNAKDELAKDLPWTLALPMDQQSILIEMVFQLGVSGLLGFRNMLFCIRSGDTDGTVHAMLDSLWHKQCPERCEELANLWLNSVA